MTAKVLPFEPPITPEEKAAILRVTKAALDVFIPNTKLVVMTFK